ncbi:RNA-directed DNA polymerase, eukaryota, reverse transcriptase zinc-binding domain protein [Tanacetum coccineum]
MRAHINTLILAVETFSFKAILIKLICLWSVVAGQRESTNTPVHCDHRIMLLQDGTKLQNCADHFSLRTFTCVLIHLTGKIGRRAVILQFLDLVPEPPPPLHLLGHLSQPEAIARMRNEKAMGCLKLARGNEKTYPFLAEFPNAVKALNEIKLTFGWRVVCAWIGNDPCGDGDLPAWSSITCSTQSDDSVVSQLLLWFLSGIKKNNVEWAEGSDEAVDGDQEIAVTSGCGMHFHGHHYGAPFVRRVVAFVRRVVAFVREDDVIHKLFTELAYQYKDRVGGYTRVLRTRIRVGDAAEMAYIKNSSHVPWPPSLRTSFHQSKASGEKMGNKQKNSQGTDIWRRVDDVYVPRRLRTEHAVHCKELRGFKYRHDMVRGVLFDVCSRAGISTKKEAPVNFLTDLLDGRFTLRPADVFDFLIVRHAALKAASCKVTKYEKAFIKNQHVFIPFVFDTFGFLAPEAVELLNRVQRVMHSNIMTPRFTNIVFKRISFAIQKGFMAQLVARLPSTTMSDTLGMERGFLSKWGVRVGRGVKEKQGLMADKSVEVSKLGNVIGEQVVKEKQSSLVDTTTPNVENTCLNSYSPLPTQGSTSASNFPSKSSYANVTGESSRKALNFRTLFTHGGTGLMSSYARTMIKLKADVELKDTIVVAMPKLTWEGFYTWLDVAKNLKKPSQASKGVSVGPKVGFKPAKEYKPVSKKPTANTSGNKKKVVEPTKEVSNSNSFDVLNLVDNDEELGTNGGTSNLASNMANSIGSFWNVKTSSIATTPIIEKIGKIEKLIIDGKVTLVDDDGNLLKKVNYPGDHDSEDDVESVDNDMARSMALEKDPYDDDMYELQDLPDKLQEICNNLDI